MNAAMTLRIDAQVKEEAAHYLSQIGLTTSEAVRLFLHSVVLHKGIPFELKVPNAQTQQVLKEVEAGINLEETSLITLTDEMNRARHQTA
jgi:DNA-damage-inducible protein J